MIRKPTAVIVGTGLAGGNAAVTLRQEGWPGRILMLGDEPGIADLSAFWDFDLSPHSLTGMRAWLTERYGTLAALNQQWGTTFTNWDAVTPDTTNEAMKRTDHNFSSWSDFKEWMDVSFARALKTGTDAVHSVDPTAYVAIEGAQQILLEKDQLDITTSPNFGPLLARLSAKSYLVYGVVTEICVRLAAFGLLKTGRRVEIVTDAVQALDENAARKMFAEFERAGGHLTTAGAVFAL